MESYQGGDGIQCYQQGNSGPWGPGGVHVAVLRRPPSHLSHTKEGIQL